MKIVMKTVASTLAVLLALPACAQQAPAPAPAPTAAAGTTADADPALWVVKDADTTVYLFGTVHVLKPGLSWFDEGVKSAFDSSKTLVLEMIEPDAAEQQRVVMAKAIDADGPPLTQKLSEADRAAYTKAVESVGAQPAMFEPFKPWMAALTLGVLPLGKLGYDPNSGAEKILTAAAKSSGKELAQLESMEEQLGFFDSLPEDKQIAYLNSTVRDLPKMGPELDRMVGHWAKGDPAALAAVMNENMKDTPEIAETLLYARNARWANWIVERMKQPGTVFVAVGAGHLAGYRSVISDLQAKKLKVERVKY